MKRPESPAEIFAWEIDYASDRNETRWETRKTAAFKGAPRGTRYVRGDIADAMLEALKIVQKYESEYRTWGIPGYVEAVRDAITEAEGNNA